MIQADSIKKVVQEHYASRAGASCGCSASKSAGDAACCVEAPVGLFEGFTGPSLGCGTPLSYADLRSGETVLDLGSGAGREVLLAAREVGSDGRAIGVDMTPEMISVSRENALRSGLSNAEFRLGEIEHLPVDSGSVDVIISNCVINLVPDKARVFTETFRALRPGGRLVVSDMVSEGDLPEAVRADSRAWAGCIAGAIDMQKYTSTIARAGFQEIEILARTTAALGQVFSVTVRARKPLG